MSLKFKNLLFISLFTLIISVLPSCNVEDEETDSTAPEVVSTFPANGATNVDPSITEISITFNEAMSGGYSLYMSQDNYNDFTGEINWETDRKIVYGVTLQPNKTYIFSININNGESYFTDTAGNCVEQVIWTFTTAPLLPN